MLLRAKYRGLSTAAANYAAFGRDDNSEVVHSYTK